MAQHQRKPEPKREPPLVLTFAPDRYHRFSNGRIHEERAEGMARGGER